MPGFFLCNGQCNIRLRDRMHDKYLCDRLELKPEATVLRQTINKFVNDKAFCETERSLIVTEGYLLNKTELFESHGVSTISDLIESMLYASNGEHEDFFKEFRGCFSGAVYIKHEEKWIIYTNQIGDNPIFYFNSNSLFAIGSQVRYIVDYCNEQGITLTFNEDAAYQMLTFAFMAGDDTFVKEIRRLHGGDYLVFQNGELEVKKYHRFEKHPDRYNTKNEEEIINDIDRAFCCAVQLEWAKDDEYCYKHIADLSGGLDSRMNLWIAHELGEKPALVTTFSKSGEPDETIARKITKYWQDEHVFFSLDDCEYMRDIDENTELLNGLSLYSGITGGNRLLKTIDINKYGIEHTGQVGDAILGSFYYCNDDMTEGKRPTGRYSERLANRLPERINKLPGQYNDYELYLMYSRGFHGACNTHLLRRNYTEIGSPFLNVDFMQLCYDIPVELRMNHYIYKKWIIQKHPKAAEFKWEKLGGKITESKVKYHLRKVFTKGPKKALKILGIKLSNKHGMNPLDYLLTKKKEIQEYLNQYMQAELENNKSQFSENLYHDIEWLYQNGNTLEKSMALTVLASAKLYFGDAVNG